MLNVKVRLVDHDFVSARWPEVEAFIRHEFKDSRFNDGFTVERPLWHITKGIEGGLGDGIKHVMAFSPEEKILAAAFCIPASREDDQESCDIGWFLSSSELSMVKKMKVLDQVFDKVHDTIKDAGFDRIITNMGTEEGAKYLGRRQGYNYQPIDDKKNRWVKELHEVQKV